jgi:threonine dehydratase
MTLADPTALPGIADVEAAARRIDGIAVRTPLLESPLLNRRLGGRLLVKAEALQRTGSFKFRGATNAIASIPADRRAAGVVAFSSGNHAQGVAAAAHAAGIPATIVMPTDAPAIKKRNTEAWGATVVPYNRADNNRDQIAAAIAAETGATLIPPFDHPAVIAGQGTVGLEIAAQCAEIGAVPDAVLTCCGGGGLTAGIALAIADRLPGTAVHPVEPEAYADTRLSLEAGAPVSIAPPPGGSLCDALLPLRPGDMTFAIMQRLVPSALSVSDDEALQAVAEAFGALRIVVEPGGAVGIAAVLAGKLPIEGRTVVAVASGGNVDPAVFVRALERFA